MNFFSRSEADTRNVAAGLVSTLTPGDVLLLHGDLGSGKTCFVQGLLEGLGWEGAVTSPTYALIQEYSTSPAVVHADLYRLLDPEEIWEIGFEELLESGAIVAVEWSERVPGFWPETAWEVTLTSDPEHPDEREIVIRKGKASA
jgi:tRNA threonylcarbamoyladenosine biosynthesis protein TsaE